MVGRLCAMHSILSVMPIHSSTQKASAVLWRPRSSRSSGRVVRSPLWYRQALLRNLPSPFLGLFTLGSTSHFISSLLVSPKQRLPTLHSLNTAVSDCHMTPHAHRSDPRTSGVFRGFHRAHTQCCGCEIGDCGECHRRALPVGGRLRSAGTP